MPTQRFCHLCRMPFLRGFTYSSFLLIRWHKKYILNLHHCCNGNNLFGAAKVSRLKEHLGKHGAERKLCHPHTHGIGQTAVMIQTWQQAHNSLRFHKDSKDTAAEQCLLALTDFSTLVLQLKNSFPLNFSTVLTTLHLTSQSVEQL